MAVANLAIVYGQWHCVGEQICECDPPHERSAHERGPVRLRQRQTNKQTNKRRPPKLQISKWARKGKLGLSARACVCVYEFIRLVPSATVVRFWQQSNEKSTTAQRCPRILLLEMGWQSPHPTTAARTRAYNLCHETNRTAARLIIERKYKSLHLCLRELVCACVCVWLTRPPATAAGVVVGGLLVLSHPRNNDEGVCVHDQPSLWQKHLVTDKGGEK